MKTLQKNVERCVTQNVIENIKELVAKYEEEQQIFKPGANPYLDGIVDGIHKVIKKLEEENING